MRDIRVKIEGPRDQAQQHIAFNITRNEGAAAASPREVLQMLADLRGVLLVPALPDVELKRSRRALETIETEVESGQPEKSELESALKSIARILKGVGSVVPTAVLVFQKLARALGFFVS